MITYSNNAVSRLVAGINDSATTIGLLPGDGAKFPSPSGGSWFPVTLVKSTGEFEIVRCTARSSDTLTIVRAQEGTEATSFSAGDRVEHRLTSGMLDELVQKDQLDAMKQTDALDNGSGKILLAGAGGLLAVQAPNWPYTTDLDDPITPSAVKQGFYRFTTSMTGLPNDWTAAVGTVENHGDVVVLDLKCTMPAELRGRTAIRVFASGAWSSWEQQDTINLRDAALADYAPLANLQWLAKPIGEPFPLWDHIEGVSVPPTDDPRFRYIKLTADDDYNDGVLTDESVTGSAPLVQATAVIDLEASPLHGQTIRLINTERRFIRAGSSGEFQDDAFQGHRHLPLNPSGPFMHRSGSENFNGGAAPLSSASTTGDPTTDGTNGTPRVANETRPRNIGATYYMRIL